MISWWLATAQGERRSDEILKRVRGEIAQATLGEIDYAELRDPESLELAGEQLQGPTLLALAVRFRPDADEEGPEVRLIDNRVLLAQP